MIKCVFLKIHSNAVKHLANKLIFLHFGSNNHLKISKEIVNSGSLVLPAGAKLGNACTVQFRAISVDQLISLLGLDFEE